MTTKKQSMKKNDRTPTLKELGRLRENLEFILEDIRINTGFKDLDRQTMSDVICYLGQRYAIKEMDYGQAQTNGHKSFNGYALLLNLESAITPQDVGLRLIRFQLESESRLKEPEKSLFFDAVLGWLSYNPGSIHKREMNRSLSAYIKHLRMHGFDIRRLNRSFEALYRRFFEIVNAAKLVQTDLEGQFKGERESAYACIFGNHAHSLVYRMDELRSKVENFSPIVRPYCSYLPAYRSFRRSIPAHA